MKRIALAIVGGAIVAIVVMLLSQRDTAATSNEASTAKPRPLAVRSGFWPNGGGVKAMQSDPAAPPSTWIGGSLDMATIGKLKPIDLQKLPWQQAAPMIGWFEGLAKVDDAAGQAIAACRYEYERRLSDGGRCAWRQNYVVRRTSDGIGRVDAQESSLPDAVSTTCRAYAACVTNASKGRVVAMPTGGDDLTGVTAEIGFVLATGATKPSADMSDDDYLAYLETRRAEFTDEATQRREYIDKLKASGKWETFSQKRRDGLERLLAVREHWVLDQGAVMTLVESELGL